MGSQTLLQVQFHERHSADVGKLGADVDNEDCRDENPHNAGGDHNQPLTSGKPHKAGVFRWRLGIRRLGHGQGVDWFFSSREDVPQPGSPGNRLAKLKQMGPKVEERPPWAAPPDLPPLEAQALNNTPQSSPAPRCKMMRFMRSPMLDIDQVGLTLADLAARITRSA
jgi:hypothetical protein|tara:strand:- start:92 stop:592 length:501 start_codon:yes stop_codon:yes gene_type:complete